MLPKVQVVRLKSILLGVLLLPSFGEGGGGLHSPSLGGFSNQEEGRGSTVNESHAKEEEGLVVGGPIVANREYTSAPRIYSGPSLEYEGGNNLPLDHRLVVYVFVGLTAPLSLY